MNATYLLMVTPEGNHNKFYRMLPNFPNDSHFTVEWGRVGATAIKKIYSMAAWDKIYKDKITKGYVDQSDLHDCVVTVLSESNYAPIADQLVAELVDTLLAYSDNAIKKNYIVSSQDVTQAMIDLAREKIDQLYSVTSLSEVNAILSQLFTIIPRKMENVEDYLAHTEMDAAEIITREEALLDIMTGKVNQKTRHENKYQDGISNTILEENNLKIRPCTMDEIRHIKKYLGKESENKLKSAFYVKNEVTEAHFYDYCSKNQITEKDIHYLYHGSRNENWWNILIQGLSLRPKKSVVRTGAMFGHGLYFALRAKKSIGYSSLKGSYWSGGTSLTGFLAVYKVAYKNPFNVYRHTPEYKLFTKENVHRLGADAILASKDQGMLVNDEVVVYDDKQATIRYLIELA